MTHIRVLLRSDHIITPDDTVCNTALHSTFFYASPGGKIPFPNFRWGCVFFEQKDRLKAYYPQSSNLERFYCNARVELSYGAVAWENRWPLFRWK